MRSLILLVAAILWFARRPTSARRYLALCVSAEALYLLAKLAFHRPRPTVIPQLGEAGWFSFPSGHSMLAPVTWGLGLVLLAQLVQARQTRMAIGIAAAMICLIIASCRIYLGVHYSTDVLAGLALGTGWVLLWWEWVVPLFPSDARDLHQPG